ncbi:hypothetical protein LUW75_15515 [Streptomyces sp. MRC013]|uniref:hypothetical protein n=1 Tax=Streptomyces sp. MRC013 TaxID=2898276 RepID=UPI002025D24F|nr:hypothetical protein [Streptomyces sp. MRC013]URM91154.1 hypothetical protein LUW75_15515 [Streptomyces sp. MRC013]
MTDSPVVVSEVHQGSGPGWNVYACPACAPHFPPVPDVLDLLGGGRAERTRECEEGAHSRCDPVGAGGTVTGSGGEPARPAGCACVCHPAG